GRRRAASSGSSSGDEERGVGSAPLPGPGPDGGAESEESERDRGGAAPSSEGARAAAEPPLPPEEPARGGRVPLSFGSDEEEREGAKELFKIKKPSFNEVTFRIQKKENPLSAEREADESKRIPELEPGTGGTEGARETEEGSYSSLSEGYNSADSEHESNPSQRRKDLSPGHLFLLDAGCIAAAWRKRHLARTHADYLPLDVSHDHQLPRRRESSDSESEDESDMNNLHFVPKMRTLRHRMAEHMGEFVPPRGC
ncbi:GCFC2 factor, partial [Odontophorus gujanensis]|nr:GCFC2 factor [Odontophorus gujanensis]